jgi:hypothetical protein
MMATRFKAIRLDPLEHVSAVLASDYDALVAAREDLQGRYDRLRAHLASRGYHRVSGCEQEAGDPYCTCAAVFEREFPGRTSDNVRG